MEPAEVEEKFKTLTGTLNNLIEDMNEKLNNFRLEYSKTVNEIQDLKRETEKIKTQMIGYKTLEWESRNKNIVIFGLKENRNESKLEILNKVTKLFTEALGKKFGEQQIDNIYRFGKNKSNRPVLIKFNNTIAKEIIIERKKIFGKWKIRVEEDFCPEIREIRKRLVEHMWRERRNGNHAILSKDKIVINGVPYDHQFYEKNHPSEQVDSEKQEDEIYSQEDLDKLKEGIDQLKNSIESLRMDNNLITGEIESKIEDRTPEKTKKESKKIVKYSNPDYIHDRGSPNRQY